MLIVIAATEAEVCLFMSVNTSQEIRTSGVASKKARVSVKLTSLCSHL